ncbi:MAG: cytochrome c-type biogenesis protein [Pyrinomonadaceae bacterium]
MRRAIAICLLFGFLPLVAVAQEAAPMAADPELEKRVLALAEELRCLVCQNETLAASQAPLAVDLRREIREQMQRGKTDSEIRAFLVERYGDFVLYRPPVTPATFLLWFGPFLLLVAGSAALFVYLKRRSLLRDHPLTEDERKRVEALLQ